MKKPEVSPVMKEIGTTLAEEQMKPVSKILTMLKNAVNKESADIILDSFSERVDLIVKQLKDKK